MPRETASFRTIFEDSPIAVAVTHGEHHAVSYSNPAFHRFLGVSPDHLTNRPLAEVLPPGIRGQVVELIDQVHLGSVAEARADLSAENGGDALRHVSCTVWSLHRGGHMQQVVEMCETAAETVARGKYEDVLKQFREVNEQLVLSNLRRDELLDEADTANRVKDEFLAMLAHELRNPLAPIRNAVHLLRLAGPVRADLEWARDVIDRQTTHLTKLVDDLLEVSRITRGINLDKERIAFADAVEAGAETARPLIDACQQTLIVTVPTAALWIDGDRVRLAQVVTNLLTNASKFSANGRRIWLTLAAEGDQAVLRVADEGIGMTADTLPRVFELFRQADQSLDRAQGGLGVGLTIVRTLVELHGGKVEAVSPGVGQGSEFIVRLPLARGSADTIGTVDRPETASVAGRRILIVDDSIDTAESLAMVLRLKGGDTRVAHDGPAALAMARSFQPEIVLLDIGLPGMNGYAVARQLRDDSRGRQPLIVAMTGYGHDEARQLVVEAGFDLHLIKPVDPLVLIGRIAACENRPR